MLRAIKSSFSSLNVHAKISIGFAIVLVLHLSVASMSHYGLSESDVKLSRFDRLHDETIEIADLLEKVDLLHRRVLLITQTGHEAQVKLARKLYVELGQRLQSSMAATTDESSRAKLRKMQAYLERHENHFDAIVVDRAKRRTIVDEDLQNRIAAFNDGIQAIEQAGANSLILAIKSSMRSAELATLQFLHNPDSRFVRKGKRHLKDTRLAVHQLAQSDGRPTIQSGTQVLIEAVDGYERSFLQMVQATRGYLHLVNVVMAGETVEFERSVHEYRAEKLGEIDTLSTAMLDESRRFKWTSNFISALTIVLGIIAAGWVSRQIAPPLNRVTDTLERLAAGESCERIPGTERTDEVGKLAAAAQVFKERASDTERHLADATTAREEAHQARRSAEELVEVIKSTNEALNEANKAAMLASQAKSEFLANMSHEIRTPMTAILGFNENLSDPSLSEVERQSAVETIGRNGEYLLGILNDILDLSKIEAGKMGVERISCSPCSIIAEVISLVRVRADAKGLTLNVDYTGSIPEAIATDPTRLRQILINLISNAVKFTEHGEVKLVASCIQDDGDKPHMQFDVVDTGLGMSGEQVTMLFQPFSQADSSTTRKFGGTGLGLTISKRFAELLGGDVSLVATKAGVGTRFRATVATGPLEGIRMLEDPDHATVVGDSADCPAKSDGPDLYGTRVLLAEDGPDNQRLLSHVLKKAGVEVTIRENGKLALAALREAKEKGCPFDVILMDMQMPVMDGYEASENLRAMGFTTPIIALTAHAMAGDRDKCIKVGCDDYATKPIDREELLELVRRHALSGKTIAMI